LPGLRPPARGATACCSKRAPTRMVRRRVVSTAGTSPSGRNSAINDRARAYGSKDAIFAMMRSYSGVHRSGMISATGLTVCRRVTAHRQGKKRGPHLQRSKHRQQPPRPNILERPLRPAMRADPPLAAIFLRLCLHKMVLQSRERPFAVRQRQPDRLSRAFGGVASARVDLVRMGDPIAPDQLHHHPPLHRALPVGRCQRRRARHRQHIFGHHRPCPIAYRHLGITWTSATCMCSAPGALGSAWRYKRQAQQPAHP
jgi:hypothetical protein